MGNLYFYRYTAIVLSLLATGTAVYGKRIPHFAGPYTIVLRRVTNESDLFNSTGQIWGKLYFTHYRPKQLQYGWGTTFLNTEINDQMKLDVQMALWANNQWKKNAIIMKFDSACTNFLKHGRSIIEFAYGPTKGCPIRPKGMVQQRNKTWEFKLPFFPVLPYGRYQVVLAIVGVENTVGLVVADLEFTPKL